MNTPTTTLEKLRRELQAMRRGDLLIVAERALALVPRAQLQTLLQDYVRVDDLAEAALPSSPLLPEVTRFETDSLAGKYYESFAVNSRDYREHSRGTDRFVAEFNRLVERCVGAADSEPASALRDAFERLFGLLRRIDKGDELIFFADEGGAWQVGVNWRRVFPAYFRCLAETAAAEDFASRVDLAIRNFAEYERPHHLLAARALGSVAQQAARDTLQAKRR